MSDCTHDTIVVDEKNRDEQGRYRSMCLDCETQGWLTPSEYMSIMPNSGQEVHRHGDDPTFTRRPR